MDEKVSYTTQDFANAYNKLCEEMGYRIVATPSFIPTNHNTFELAVELQVAPIKQ